jgi:hypothetical protein
LAVVTAESWRLRYLPPLHRLGNEQVLSAGGYGVWWSSRGIPPDNFGTTFAWPDGKPLSAADQMRSTAWLNAHHIRLLTLYQPGSRYWTFQLIEFGWLAILATILITATVLLVRRRPA